MPTEEEPLKKNHRRDSRSAAEPDTLPLPTADAAGDRDPFDEFWTVYPRRVGKAKARPMFARLVAKHGADVILAGARRFAADPNLPAAEFIPHPLTWLARGGWDDDPLPARSADTSVHATVGEHAGSARTMTANQWETA